LINFIKSKLTYDRFIVLFTFTSFFILGVLGSKDDIVNRNSLSCLDWFVAEVIKVSDYYSNYHDFSYLMRGMEAVSVIIFVIYLFKILIKKENNYLYLAICSAVLAQYLVFLNRISYAYFGYALSFIFSLKSKKVLNEDYLDNFFKYFLPIVIILAIVLRIYSLNYLVDYFEGEISPYSAGATSFRGLWKASVGTNGPWSPLGYLYYFPLLLITEIFGSSLYALRLSSVFLDLFSITVLYFVVKSLFNFRTSAIAYILYSITPLFVGWSRSDIFPLGSTSWVAMILVWSTYNLLVSQRVKYFIITSIFMALSWHQYPSGQAAVLIPCLSIFIYSIFNVKFLYNNLYKLVFILLGLLLWIIGQNIVIFFAIGKFSVVEYPGYLRLLGNRFPAGYEYATENISTNYIYTLSSQILNNLIILVKGMYCKVDVVFHQTFIPAPHSFHGRALPWFIVSLFICGVALVAKINRKIFLVLIMWFFTGMLPGILSDYAYIKRAATIYPVIVLFASVTLSVFLNSLCTNSFFKRVVQLAFTSLFFVNLSINFQYWFSQHRWNIAKPETVLLTESIKKVIKSNRIIVFDVCTYYGEGKYTYLLQDALNNEENIPTVWYVTSREPIKKIQQLSTDPKKLVDEVENNDWYYLWTDLFYQIGLYEKANWESVIYILEEGSFECENGGKDTPTHKKIEAIKKHCKNPKYWYSGPTERNKYKLNYIQCSL